MEGWCSVLGSCGEGRSVGHDCVFGGFAGRSTGELKSFKVAAVVTFALLVGGFQ